MTMRAGAARLPLDPPLGLPMVGFVRQPDHARAHGRFALEVGAVVLEQGGTRVALVGVDTCGIAGAAVDELVVRVAGAVGAEPAGVLLNWNHTHLSPPARDVSDSLYGDLDADTTAAVAAFARTLEDTITAACVRAAERLEPAAVVWGQTRVDLAVNRRERPAGGGEAILGWHPDGLVDDQVTVLQLRRPDALRDSDADAIATLVGFGCHPVTTGHDLCVYSADYPGAMRETVAAQAGGVCVFLQGAGGNVLPRFAFTDDEHEAAWMGRRLGLAALAAVADRSAAPLGVTKEDDGSVTPVARYRRAALATPEPALAAASRRVPLPLLPHRSLGELAALRAQYDADLEAARASGERGRVKLAWYHAAWARRTEAAVRDGSAPHEVPGAVHAVRVGDGLIVTGPGETFSEIGLAVKERAPGAPTLYLGYTNGLVGYLPTAAEYPFGGYEPGNSHRGFGQPSGFAPACERLLVEAGVRLGEQLFPDASPWDGARGWEATGALPELPAAPAFERPR